MWGFLARFSCPAGSTGIRRVAEKADRGHPGCAAEKQPGRGGAGEEDTDHGRNSGGVADETQAGAHLNAGRTNGCKKHSGTVEYLHFNQCSVAHGTTQTTGSTLFDFGGETEW